LLGNVKILHEQMRCDGVIMLCGRLCGKWKTLSLCLSLSYLQIANGYVMFSVTKWAVAKGKYW